MVRTSVYDRRTFPGLERNHVFKVGVHFLGLWYYYLSTEKIDRSTQFGEVGYIITLYSSKSYVKTWGFVQIFWGVLTPDPQCLRPCPWPALWRAIDGWLPLSTVRCMSADMANSATHPLGVDIWVVSWTHAFAMHVCVAPPPGECFLRVKAYMVLLAGNSVWSISERVRGVREDALYKSTLPLLLPLPLPDSFTRKQGRPQGFKNVYAQPVESGASLREMIRNIDNYFDVGWFWTVR